MPTEKNLLTTKRYFNASPVDEFVNLELTGEKSFIKPDKTDNVIDLYEKFNEERNACMKFCIYGMIQSKWCDSDAIKIDFRITDSSTNVSPSTQPNMFWVYDKSTNVTATTWSVVSRPLDNDGGKLSINLYRKKKGSYFFPFELDPNSLTKGPNGINTNKSIIVKISDPSKNSFLETEIPFLFFDEEGTLIDFGQETAEILDDGNVIEINNDYPYFYDRHWLRRELIPNGPPYVFFVSSDSIEITEGSSDPRVGNDKLFPVEIALSQPSVTGMERVNVEVVYGLDESKLPYTTVTVPSDVILGQNYVNWNYVGEDPLKYIYIRVVDDFFVEPTEKITLRLTPVFGCVADPNRSQTLQLYFKDNDVPSYVSFENANISFVEPRQDTLFVPIRINMNLDKSVLVDDQYFDLYIDRNETDSKGVVGFVDPASSTGISDSARIYVSQNVTSFYKNLNFKPVMNYDLERKVVLRMSGFTVNLAPSSVSTNSENKLVINCTKQIDDNYCLIEIPYDGSKGHSVIRNVYNVPQSDYTNEIGQKVGTEYPTIMAFDWISNYEGKLTPNSKYQISATTATSVPSNQTNPQVNRKTVVVEQEFSIDITNLGETPVILDNNLYGFNQTMNIDVGTGATLSTSYQYKTFIFDGEKFILRLPANTVPVKSTPTPIYPYTGGSWVLAAQQALVNGTLSYTAATYGFTKCNYSINIRNKTYNYLGDPISSRSETDRNSFYKTNLLTKPILQRTNNSSGGFSYSPTIIFNAGNDRSTKTYYAGTMMQGAVTRPIEPISSATGTTVSLVPDEYFYNGIAILPTRPIQGNPTVTASFIFVSERKVVDVGGITRPVSGTSTLGYNAVLPTSPVIITEPLSARTYFCPFSFGKLKVQNGYGNITYWPNGYTSNSASSDAFALVNNVNGSSTWENNTVIPWSMANPNLRNQAVIEIVNTGQIESYFPNGIVLKPGERLAISELPVTPSNGTSGFYNIVRPLFPLVLNLSTNYGYDKTFEKFLKCRYRISFLNFKLYNKNGTFSNKVANNSINFEDTVVEERIVNGIVTNIVKPRFLLTRYGKEVWMPKSPSGGINCSYAVWSNMQKLSSFYSRRYAYIQGITMTASIDSPIDTCTFVEFGDLPPNVPGLTNNWASCGDFTIY